MTIDEELKILKKGVAEIISEEDLRKKLEKSHQENKPLTIKLGLDPSAPDIHMGHTVVLRKLKQFQDLGHQIVLIIGDFTGMIGDPTGKSETRKQLTREQVLENAKTYQKQIYKILDPDRTIIRFNSEWLAKLSFEDVIVLCSKYTVSRMLEREDFKKRMESQQPISIHEFFYPLMQAYDSIALAADVELGGTDQKFNILMGRTLQREYGQEPQVAMLMPILEGTDGVKKMSKSLGNYIGINESPDEIYGKTMSIPDELIIRYYELLTDIHPDKLNELKEQMESSLLNPRDVKMALAKELVTLYHGAQAAQAAEKQFVSIFQKGDIPDDIEEIKVPADVLKDSIWLPRFLADHKLAPTSSEGRRLIQQGAVKINGQKSSEENVRLKSGDIIQVGKRRFAKILPMD
ncbi:tyrosine--tRNA ligase [Mahella australiensis]|uniref:Tyrosine--tRNA ligase n=1 Tax=Mahella australiensis (strain DSM 15567 / CIP 107919 / 50-1 BON) TaxID=697281 RepID=F3ZVK1_MAHA5|nr:tyrosine--tRNA ligase [Mahella australiensis]AEE96363.1 tyrosyl-tRNA synthetase [Mahella australiensis 50-1 BON]